MEELVIYQANKIMELEAELKDAKYWEAYWSNKCLEEQREKEDEDVRETI